MMLSLPTPIIRKREVLDHHRENLIELSEVKLTIV
jgi:hypothetical protein